jgi:hypothetical protein
MSNFTKPLVPGGTVSDPNAIKKQIINSKGDLIAGLSDDTPGTIGPGSDGQILSSDSNISTGLRWIDHNNPYLINWEARRDGDPSLLSGIKKAFYVGDCGYRSSDGRDFVELTTDNTNRNGWVYFDMGRTDFKGISFEVYYTIVSTAALTTTGDGYGVCPVLDVIPTGSSNSLTGFGNYVFIAEHNSDLIVPDKLKINSHGLNRSTNDVYSLFDNNSQHPFIIKGSINGSILEFSVTYIGEHYASDTYVLGLSETFIYGRYFAINAVTGTERSSQKIHAIIVKELF